MATPESVTGQGLQQYKTVLYVLALGGRQGVVPVETQVTVLFGFATPTITRPLCPVTACYNRPR
jgi:hypothetical protein